MFLPKKARADCSPLRLGGGRFATCRLLGQCGLLCPSLNCAFDDTVTPSAPAFQIRVPMKTPHECACMSYIPNTAQRVSRECVIEVLFRPLSLFNTCHVGMGSSVMKPLQATVTCNPHHTFTPSLKVSPRTACRVGQDSSLFNRIECCKNCKRQSGAWQTMRQYKQGSPSAPHAGCMPGACWVHAGCMPSFSAPAASHQGGCPS